MEEDIEQIRALGRGSLAEGLERLLVAATSDKREITQSALVALDELMGRHPQTPIRQPDLFRGNSRDSNALIQVLRRNRKSWGLAVASAFDSNGYVREAAVRNLIRQPIDKVLPYLMVRSADWVPGIAGFASDRVVKKVPSASDATLVSSFSSFAVLARKVPRSTATNWWTEYRRSRSAEAYRHQVESRPGVLRVIRSETTQSEQRFLVEIELIGVDEDWRTVLGQAIASDNQTGVALALKKVRALPREQQLVFIEELATSQSAHARVVAIELADGMDRVDLLQAGVTDRNWRVRNDARFYLKRRGTQNFLATYREQLPTPWAIAGFAEVATDAELAELIPFIDHPMPAVRSEAIRTFGRREVATTVPSIEARLEDRSPSVIRASVKALKQLHMVLPLERARLLAQRHNRSAETNGATLFTLTLLPRWDHLAFLLQLMSVWPSADDIKTQLLMWINRRTRDRLGPSQAQLMAVEAAIDVAEKALAFGISSSIRAEIAHWRKQRFPTG